jgi:NADH-quinone oxidoreductase subunit E
MRLKATKRLDLELDRAQRVLARFDSGSDSRVLGLAVQAKLGYVPEVSIREIAEKAGRSREAVLSELAADGEIRLTPRGDHRVTICTGTTCAPRGGVAMLKLARRQLGINVFDTSEVPDQDTIRLDAQKCLGRCAMAPNVRIDGQLKGAMSEKRLDALLAVLRRSRGKSGGAI